jgi:glutamine---fructose-6-phosphate transaminase (isomerizing)
MARTNYKMIKEIKEQSKVARRIITARIKDGKVIFPEFKDRQDDLKKIKRIIFLGCGTSFHAAYLGNLWFEKNAKLNCEAEFADEFNKREAVIEPNTAVIILSQSGETAEVIKAVKIARQKKALTVGITNNNNSRLAKMVDAHLFLNAGKEVAVPATKTFTSQLLILLLLSLFFAQLKSDKKNKAAQKILTDLKRLPATIEKIFAKENVIKNVASELQNEQRIIVLGDKFNYPIALEGALKLKEAANIFAEGMAAAEFAHGPKTLVDRICLINLSGRNLSIDKVKIALPATSEFFSPILLVVHLQLLTFYLAMQKGINVDRPRNIKKFIK